MSAKKMGLGRGLNTLIPKAPIVDEEDVEQVKKKVSRSSKTKKKEETKKELTCQSIRLSRIQINQEISLMRIRCRNLQILLNSMECYSQSSLLQRMISMRSLQGEKMESCKTGRIE